jgi:hypothetical protein
LNALKNESGYRRSVPPFAHQGDRPALLVEGVMPRWAERDASLELVVPVPSDPLEGEGRCPTAITGIVR